MKTNKLVILSLFAFLSIAQTAQCSDSDKENSFRWATRPLPKVESHFTFGKNRISKTNLNINEERQKEIAQDLARQAFKFMPQNLKYRNLPSILEIKKEEDEISDKIIIHNGEIVKPRDIQKTRKEDRVIVSFDFPFL